MSLRRQIRRALGVKEIPDGYSPIERTEPEDVFIVGYPKSGNTWFQNIILGVMYGVDARLSPPVLARDLVPDVHFNGFYRRYSKPMYFKSHHLPQASYRRVVYLLRDGRDVMVSYYHYLEALEKRKLDFLELVKNGLDLLPCKWHEHVEAWEKNSYGADMLFVRYEDMISDPMREVKRFVDFVRYPADEALLKKAVEAASFGNLQEREKRLGSTWPEQWPSDKKFFRRGIAGSYKDEMPSDVLQEFFKQAAPTLARYKYSV
jgi:hypothetical protein